ncbi:MAG: putative secreted protein [Herbinix sp.]|jgi:hypothetical protein|nr:putative secreted protein [Herbinix sp.]
MNYDFLKKLFIRITLATCFLLLPRAYASASDTPTMSETKVNILEGKTYDLDIRNAPKNSTYRWQSFDEKIVTVTKDGMVKGIKKGKTEILCKVTSAEKSYYLSAKVYVHKPASAIKINSSVEYVRVGQEIDLEYQLSPQNSIDSVIWSSSDTTIANPDLKGTFTVLKSGAVTISATTENGATASIQIKAIDKGTLTITPDNLKDASSLLTAKCYESVVISNTVGSPTIAMNNVTIFGTLSLESGADYTVEAVNSSIHYAQIFLPKEFKNGSKDLPVPSLQIGDGSTVDTVMLDTTSVLKQSPTAKISSITISPWITGDITLSLFGYRGDITMDSTSFSSVKAELTDCAIGTISIIKIGGYTIDLISDQQHPSTVDTIDMKTSYRTKVAVKTNQLIVEESAADLTLIIAAPINQLIHHGSSDLRLQLEAEGFVKEFVDIPNKQNNTYGTYSFQNYNSPSNYIFDLKIGNTIIEDLNMDYFDQLFYSNWYDKSISYQSKNIKIEPTTLKDIYKIILDGTEILMCIITTTDYLCIYSGSDYQIINLSYITPKQ